jgi:hypothetical protein
MMAFIIVALFILGFVFPPLWIGAVIALIIVICRPKTIIIADPNKPRPDGIGRFVDGALRPKPRRKPSQFESAFPAPAPEAGAPKRAWSRRRR